MLLHYDSNVGCIFSRACRHRSGGCRFCCAPCPSPDLTRPQSSVRSLQIWPTINIEIIIGVLAMAAGLAAATTTIIWVCSTCSFVACQAGSTCFSSMFKPPQPCCRKSRVELAMHLKVRKKGKACQHSVCTTGHAAYGWGSFEWIYKQAIVAVEHFNGTC